MSGLDPVPRPPVEPSGAGRAVPEPKRPKWLVPVIAGGTAVVVLAVASVSINVTVNSTQCRMDASIMVVLGVFNAFVRNGDSLMSPARNAAPSWVIPTVRNRDAGTCADTPDHGMKPQMSATSVRNMISSSSGTRNRTVARNFGIT